MARMAGSVRFPYESYATIQVDDPSERFKLKIKVDDLSGRSKWTIIVSDRTRQLLNQIRWIHVEQKRWRIAAIWSLIESIRSSTQIVEWFQYDPQLSFDCPFGSFRKYFSDLTRFYKRRIWWIPKSQMKYSLVQFVMTSIWSKVEKWTHKSKLNKSEAHWQDS